MEKRESCNVIMDLLPSYVDGICSQESRQLVQEHLKTCSDCQKVYQAMKEEAGVSATSPSATAGSKSSGTTSNTSSTKVTIDETAVLKKVHRKMHKVSWVNTIAGVVAGVVLLALLILIIRPTKTLAPKDYTVTGIGYDLRELRNPDDVGIKFGEAGENVVYIYDENKKIDECRFVSVEIPGYYAAEIFVDTDYIEQYPFVTVVTLTSDHSISSFSHEVDNSSGQNILRVTKVKTPMFPGNNDSTTSVSTLEFCKIDGVEN
ncbi:MAG: zf-HC2 domain-containing protein [Clostridiales bacterium]|nr:zf-HC2 domain-containing protein [Clostridiales bacterium]